MSLIEHLDQDHGEEFLRSTFEYVLYVLEHDRYRPVGSGADDLRAWLARGGMPRVKERLTEQMAQRQFTPEQQAAVHRTLAQLEASHRDALQALIAAGVIELPATGP
jgi:hypothetical protein